MFDLPSFLSGLAIGVVVGILLVVVIKQLKRLGSPKLPIWPADKSSSGGSSGRQAWFTCPVCDKDHQGQSLRDTYYNLLSHCQKCGSRYLVLRCEECGYLPSTEKPPVGDYCSDCGSKFTYCDTSLCRVK